MKILHISDTHSCHRRLINLPEADIVVHSGDFTMNGSEQEAIDFLNWFCDLPYKHKIFICGNKQASTVLTIMCITSAIQVWRLMK